MLAFGNALVDSAEATRLGVFDEAVAPERVTARACEVAAELAGFPPEVYARTKRDLRGAVWARLRESAAGDPLLAQWVS